MPNTLYEITPQAIAQMQTDFLILVCSSRDSDDSAFVTPATLSAVVAELRQRATSALRDIARQPPPFLAPGSIVEVANVPPAPVAVEAPLAEVEIEAAPEGE